jgi:hypothetical protein
MHQCVSYAGTVHDSATAACHDGGATSQSRTLLNQSVALPAGAGQLEWVPVEAALAARIGLGRIVTLYHRSSTLYTIH